MGTELVQTRFEARVDDIEHVYDGDTINHVQFRLPDIEVLKGGHLGEVYPDIFSQQDGVWIHVNVRVAGIDAPERHPRHRYPDGSLRPPEDIAREHALAMRARQVVVDLLEANHLRFQIRNPELGKYAQRVVAELWARDPETTDLINVGEQLINQALAYPYEGGTKRVWGRDC